MLSYILAYLNRKQPVSATLTGVDHYRTQGLAPLTVTTKAEKTHFTDIPVKLVSM